MDGGGSEGRVGRLAAAAKSQLYIPIPDRNPVSSDQRYRACALSLLPLKLYTAQKRICYTLKKDFFSHA